MENILEHKNSCFETRRQERHKDATLTQSAISKIDDKVDSFIDKAKEEHNSLKNTLALNTQAMTNIEKGIQEIKDELKEMRNSFASKWVEKVMVWAWWVIWTIILTSLMYLIIIKK